MLVVVLMSALACLCVGDISNPFKTFTPAELVGAWRADYGIRDYWTFQVTGVETLTLRADGTYQQVYMDGKGYEYISLWNKWYLERGYILHLEGGRFYPMGIEAAEGYARGGVLTVWPGIDPIELSDEIILFVQHSSTTPGGVTLEYPPPPIGDPDNPHIVTFYRIATPAPMATVSP